MLDSLTTIGDVTPAVQLALTPAFLLTGIAGILNVMTHRLGRIIDRGRQLSEIGREGGTPQQDHLVEELNSLERRRHLASAAINMSVLSALLVCSVVTVLFLEALMHLSLKWLIGSLFMGATITLVLGLALFLREVHLATHSIRILRTSVRKST